MKTSLIIAAAIIILYKVPKTEGKEKFECPVDCPSNVYRPICSRGKSYANLCVLKQEICKGKTAREIYDDVEACPGYEKEEDASGKSVEAIDRNGVIFRHLIDTPKKNLSLSTELPKRSTSTVRTIKKLYCTRRGDQCVFIGGSGRRYERSFLGRAFLPFCTRGHDFSRYRTLRLLFCRSFLPTVPIFFVGGCQKCSEKLRPSRGKKSPIDKKFKRFAHFPKFDNSLKRSKNQGVQVDPMLDRKFNCQINCDPNEYRPVCAGKRAFRNECYLNKAFCSGSIGRDILKAAKTCPQARNKRRRK